MTISLGVIETIGLTSAIHAADAACKAAGVHLTGYRKVGAGLVSIYLQGEISAVKAAVDSGLEALAQQAGQATSTVMARPDPSVLAMLENGALDKGDADDGGQAQGSAGPDDVPPAPPAPEVSPKNESGSLEGESSAQADSSIAPELTESIADNQSSAEHKTVTDDTSPEGAKPTKPTARRQSAARRKKSTNNTSTRGSKQ